MFSRAAKIRISSTATFYLLTLVLSIVLLKLLQVSPRNFCFGVAAALLAHAAVYLLRRDSVPVWAAVFVLALVMPMFPPEALMPIERGALYWGILAVLLSYGLTYGAHSLLSARDAQGGPDPQMGRRKKLDRHTGELFTLLNVTSFSQAIRAVRKLLQERDRQQEHAGAAGDGSPNAESAEWQRKLRESQSQLKQLRKQLEDARQPRASQRRQMQDRLEQVQRQMEEMVASKDQAVDRAHALEGFQLRVAELSQQMNVLRGEMQQTEMVVQELQARAAEAEQARAAACAERERLAREMAQLVARLEQSEAARAAAQTAKEHLEQALAGSETEKQHAAAELNCVRSQLREHTLQTAQAAARIQQLEQDVHQHQQQLQRANEIIASLEDSLSFYRQSIEDLTPEVDRLDGIINRYQTVYGPLPHE